MMSGQPEDLNDASLTSAAGVIVQPEQVTGSGLGKLGKRAGDMCCSHAQCAYPSESRVLQSHGEREKRQHEVEASPVTPSLQAWSGLYKNETSQQNELKSQGNRGN